MKNGRSINLEPKWGCSVVGELSSSNDVRELSADMLEVHCLGGITIEAGWHPEASEKGRYVITVTRGLSYVVPPVERATAEEAKDLIEGFAERFSNESSQSLAAGVCDQKLHAESGSSADV